MKIAYLKFEILISLCLFSSLGIAQESHIELETSSELPQLIFKRTDNNIENFRMRMDSNKIFLIDGCGFLGCQPIMSLGYGIGVDIHNISIAGDVISSDELTINSNIIKFGGGFSSPSRTDFTFYHESGSSAEKGLTIENDGGNKNRWTFYTLNGSGDMSLTRNETVVGTFASDGVYTSSDRKLKNNITTLKQVLPRILDLVPSKYDYKDSDNLKKSIGFIAQDVNKYFPELVLNNPMDDGEVVMQLNYAGFGVLAIKAIQEQQDQLVSQQLKLNAQAKRIEKQEQIIESMQSQMNDLLVRISSLEEREKR